jgi:hypothetical protein
MQLVVAQVAAAAAVASEASTRTTVGDEIPST